MDIFVRASKQAFRESRDEISRPTLPRLSPRLGRLRLLHQAGDEGGKGGLSDRFAIRGAGYPGGDLLGATDALSDRLDRGHQAGIVVLVQAERGEEGGLDAGGGEGDGRRPPDGSDPRRGRGGGRDSAG